MDLRHKCEGVNWIQPPLGRT